MLASETDTMFEVWISDGYKQNWSFPISCLCCVGCQFSWHSQEGRGRKTSILVLAFWNFKLKVLKYQWNFVRRFTVATLNFDLKIVEAPKYLYIHFCFFFRDNGITIQILKYQLYSEGFMFILVLFMVIYRNRTAIEDPLFLFNFVIFVIQPLFYLNGDVNFRNRVLQKGLLRALYQELFPSNNQIQPIAPWDKRIQIRFDSNGCWMVKLLLSWLKRKAVIMYKILSILEPLLY